MVNRKKGQIRERKKKQAFAPRELGEGTFFQQQKTDVNHT